MKHHIYEKCFFGTPLSIISNTYFQFSIYFLLIVPINLRIRQNLNQTYNSLCTGSGKNHYITDVASKMKHNICGHLQQTLFPKLIDLLFSSKFFVPVPKGPFINYVRVPREGGLKNLYILLLWGAGVKPILT